MRALLATLLFCTAALAGCTDPADGDGGDNGTPGTGCQDMMPADPTGGHSYVCMQTNKGDFLVELFDGQAPVTVDNFLQYVQSGFYNNTAFHRVVKDFVIQGGGMDQESGEMKQTRPAIRNEAQESGLENDQWTLSMARTSAPDSATSQFFVNVVDNPALDPGGASPAGYAVFGKVVAGQDTVQAIHDVPTGQHADGLRCLPSGEPSCPQEPVFISGAHVVRQGSASEAADEARRAAEEEEAQRQARQSGPPQVEIDLLTPGTWTVDGRPDHMVLWAHNAGGDADERTWSVTLQDGSDLPEGWSLSFDPPTADLAPVETVEGSGVSTRYADWSHTVATLELPDDASGTYEVTFHLGDASTDATLEVTSPVRVAQEGDSVLVHTVGTLQRDGEEFWTGDFPTQAGTGQAITGYRLGLLGLAEGDTVSLVIPPALAYGYAPYSDHELAGETLVFTIDHEFQE